MARWTKTQEDIEEFARVQQELGDMDAARALIIQTKEGKTYSGQVVMHGAMADAFSSACQGHVVIHTGDGKVEIDYLDIDTVTRITAS